jgi:hypothetical protein
VSVQSPFVLAEVVTVFFSSPSSQMHAIPGVLSLFAGCNTEKTR